MPVMNSGTPFGASKRSPSPELAAEAGSATTTLKMTAHRSAHRTAPQLTTLGPARHRGVAQREVHRLQRKVWIGHAEPVPILIAICFVRSFPEPHETDF
jgi:hypothetical protein